MKYRFFWAIIFGSSSYAINYNNFESFNNAVSIGLGVSNLNLSNSSGSSALTSNVSYQLDIERLFKNNLWFNLNGSIVVSNLTSQANGIGSSHNNFKSPFTQNPSLGGINVSIGYAVLEVYNTLIIPFVNLGRNTNLAASTVYFNNNKNITNNFYYTLGIGSRFDFITNEYALLYLKPYINYNFDQSGPLNGIMPQNNLTYNIVLGSKLNIYKNLQIGINGYYSYYQTLSDLPLDKYTGYSVYSAVNNGGYGLNLNFGIVY